MRRTTIGSRRFRGLTLVELMLVMMAMLIMGSLVWKTATTVLGWANSARMSLEVSQISQGLDAFCAHFNDYPPDFHDQIIVWKFMKAHFPKCPKEKYPDFASQSPATALYFWLGGPNGMGFSANPENPFDDNKHRIGPFFKFDRSRLKLVDDPDVRIYLPPGSKTGVPYLYFRGGTKGYDGSQGWEESMPYRSSVDFQWVEPGKYQLLCPGNDGKYGAGNHYPGGTDYDAANMDDITSFSQGETLGRQIPKLIPSQKKEEEGPSF
jgi:hypothetical protein